MGWWFDTLLLAVSPGTARAFLKWSTTYFVHLAQGRALSVQEYGDLPYELTRVALGKFPQRFGDRVGSRYSLEDRLSNEETFFDFHDGLRPGVVRNEHELARRFPQAFDARISFGVDDYSGLQSLPLCVLASIASQLAPWDFFCLAQCSRVLWAKCLLVGFPARPVVLHLSSKKKYSLDLTAALMYAFRDAHCDLVHMLGTFAADVQLEAKQCFWNEPPEADFVIEHTDLPLFVEFVKLMNAAQCISSTDHWIEQWPPESWRPDVIAELLAFLNGAIQMGASLVALARYS